MSDPTPIQAVMGPLAKLQARLAADTHAKEVGVDIVQFLVAPGNDVAGPHHVRAIFTVCPGEGDGETEIDVPDDLAEQLRNGPVAADAERADAARKDLEVLRDELKDHRKGIGLDD